MHPGAVGGPLSEVTFPALLPRAPATAGKPRARRVGPGARGSLSPCGQRWGWSESHQPFFWGHQVHGPSQVPLRPRPTARRRPQCGPYLLFLAASSSLIFLMSLLHFSISTTFSPSTSDKETQQGVTTERRGGPGHQAPGG